MMRLRKARELSNPFPRATIFEVVENHYRKLRAKEDEVENAKRTRVINIQHPRGSQLYTFPAPIKSFGPEGLPSTLLTL